MRVRTPGAAGPYAQDIQRQLPAVGCARKDTRQASRSLHCQPASTCFLHTECAPAWGRTRRPQPALPPGFGSSPSFCSQHHRERGPRSTGAAGVHGPSASPWNTISHPGKSATRALQRRDTSSETQRMGNASRGLRKARKNNSCTL